MPNRLDDFGAPTQRQMQMLHTRFGISGAPVRGYAIRRTWTALANTVRPYGPQRWRSWYGYGGLFRIADYCIAQSVLEPQMKWPHLSLGVAARNKRPLLLRCIGEFRQSCTGDSDGLTTPKSDFPLPTFLPDLCLSAGAQ
jgi:hypothetical protein